MLTFVLGYIVGGIINVFIFAYLLLNVDDKQEFINEYSKSWDKFHSL